MRMLLLSNVPKLGHQHDVVMVAKGYAMNFLVPQGVARIATDAEIARVEQIKKAQQEKSTQMKERAQELKTKLDDMKSIELSEKTTETGTLYGSVSKKTIADLLTKTLGVEIPETALEMSSTIKELGEHPVKVQLADGISSTINVNVTSA